MHKVNILGVEVDPITLNELLKRVSCAVEDGKNTQIAHVNVMGINLAYKQSWLRDFLNQADIVYCDGMGVLLGARLLGYPLPERLTLADWVWSLAEMCATRGYSIYLLGNPPGVAKRAAQKLCTRYPDLCVSGVMHGYFEKTASYPENEAVLAQINAVQPAILMVGFGMPMQEKWLMENRVRINAPVAITCGALFEYLSGDLKRGPDWMTQHYLEWLARLVISPRRYAKRYFRDIPLFIARVLRQRLKSSNPA